jgi:hypothetical protein
MKTLIIRKAENQTTQKSLMAQKKQVLRYQTNILKEIHCT